MIIEGNKIYSDSGKYLFRKEDDFFAGTERSLGYTYYIDNKPIDSPHLEVPDDYYEMTAEEIASKRQEYYLSLVEPFIRERYSLSQELAIQRQRDTKPEAFNEYFDYCEGCKAKARGFSNSKYPEIK